MSEKRRIHIPVLHAAPVSASVSVTSNLGSHSTQKKLTQAPAHLTYNASTEKIEGWIGHDHFNEIAYSGGSRGHKKVSAGQAREFLHYQSDSFLSRLSTTGEKKDAHGNYLQRGGTIPPGHYICQYVAHHKSFNECIRLEQTKDAHAIYSPFASMPIVHHRASFYIHGHGPKGSDGCLVLKSEDKRMMLNRSIKNYNGEVILEVTNVSYLLPAEVFDYNNRQILT